MKKKTKGTGQLKLFISFGYPEKSQRWWWGERQGLKDIFFKKALEFLDFFSNYPKWPIQRVFGYTIAYTKRD